VLLLPRLFCVHHHQRCLRCVFCSPDDPQEVDIEHELGIELAHDDDEEEHEEEKHEGM
jgi:hypothetical protein